MAPQPRPGWVPGVSPEESRVAAALLLVFPVDGVPHVVLTVRSSRLPSHAGQVSLPGGALEPGETLESAALREAQEEVGLDPGGVRVLGRLTPLHIPVSGFMLNVVVAVTDHRPVLRPADSEVEQILEVPIGTLDLSRVRHKRDRRAREGIEVDIPYLDVHGTMLWGATAMVLSEFLSLL